MKFASRPASARRAAGFISMTMLMMVGLVVFLLWAALFEIDQTVRAQGQVIPSSRTQVVQAADGGVLSSILVQEGQVVKAGQTLAILERDRPNAAFQESRTRQAALAAALARTQAEARDEAPRFPASGNSEFEAVQRALYEQRRRSLDEELATLKEGLDLAREELRMNEALLRTGDISQLEVMRARRQVSELEGKINAARNKYLQEARQESTKLAEDLSSNRYKVEERQNVLAHTTLVAPVAGIVKYLKITTNGGVLRAGDELLQISPTDGGLVIEVRLNPVDIGQLRLGLPVTIKLDAFDYSIYGMLQGTLTYISSDTLNEQNAAGQTSTFYRVHVRVDEDRLNANTRLAQVQLKPGMTASVDIRTDSRSVLQYLAKPVFKAFSGALTER